MKPCFDSRQHVGRELPTSSAAASLTKPFAATVLLLLVQEGQLEFGGSWIATNGVDFESQGVILVRHLLSHTSEGLPGETYRLQRDSLWGAGQGVDGCHGEVAFATEVGQRIS